MPICFVNNGVLDFGELTDLEKQWYGWAPGFTPPPPPHTHTHTHTHLFKKPEREASVSHSHVHYLEVSFVIKSVGANGLWFFLFFLFCATKLINLKTFGGWEELPCLATLRGRP